MNNSPPAGLDFDKTLLPEGSRLFEILKERVALGASDPHLASLKVTVNGVCYKAALLANRVADVMKTYTLHDERHAKRVLDYMHDLLPEKVVENLSTMEIALLVMAAYVHDLGMCVDKQRVDSMRPLELEPEPDGAKERRDWEHFLAECPEEVQRAKALKERGQEQSASEICGYLLTEFVRRSHGARLEQVFQASVCQGADLTYKGYSFARPLVTICASHTEPLGYLLGKDEWGRPRLDAECVVGLGDKTEQVNELFIATVLRLADVFDLDPKRAPKVLFDHLGISSGLSLEQWRMYASIRVWKVCSDSLELRAKCEHPAVQKALSVYCDLVEAELANAALVMKEMGGPRNKELLGRLRLELPSSLSHLKLEGKIQVGPGAGSDGDPLYEYHDLSFELSRDRIIQLFMGQALYQEPRVAIRELYQNALDACRYKRARVEWINTERTDEKTVYNPIIVFRQGEDNGRPYIECRDNGIGMGLDELKRYFARIGERFCTSPEFLGEQHEWLTRNVRMHANSRFGIGVLSYFMLAEEVVIETRRFDKNGVPAPKRLRVSIPGSGSLFHIRPLLCGDSDTGTLVRLYLRSSTWKDAEGRTQTLDCVTFLREKVQYSEERLTAESTTDREEWASGELGPHFRGRRSARLGALPIWFMSSSAQGGFLMWPLLGGERFSLLLDNIETDSKGPPCVLVNLTGELAEGVALSIDRSRVQRWDEGRVEKAIAEGLERWWHMKPTLRDFYDFALARPHLALDLLRVGASTGRRLRHGSRAVPAADFTLCFCDFRMLAETDRNRSQPPKAAPMLTDPRGLPNVLLRVKGSPYAQQGPGSSGWSYGRMGRGLPGLVSRTAFVAVLLDRAHHLRAMGLLELPEGFPATPVRQLHLTWPDEVLLGGETLVPGAVLWAHVLSGVSIHTLVERARELAGAGLVELSEKVRTLNVGGLQGLGPSLEDCLLLSEDGDGRPPWVEKVGGPQLVGAAGKSGVPPSQLLGRAKQLANAGLADLSGALASVDFGKLEKLELTTHDRLLLSRDSDGNPPWVEKVGPRQMVGATRESGVPLSQLLGRARQIAEAGLVELSEGLASADFDQLERFDLTPGDWRILSRFLDGESPWAEELGLPHLACAAKQLHVPISQVLGRAREMAEAGVAELSAKAAVVDVGKLEALGLTADDLVLLSMSGDGEPPWVERVGLLQLLYVHARRRGTVFEVSFSDLLARAQQLSAAGVVEVSEGIAAVDVGELVIPELTGDDWLLLSRFGEGQPPWVERLGLPQLVDVYGSRRHSVFKASLSDLLVRVQRLAATGVVELEESLASLEGTRLEGVELTEGDLVLLSRDGDGLGPWVSAVGGWDGAFRTIMTGWEFERVYSRLKELEQAGLVRVQEPLVNPWAD